jgi:hypothetical protein
MSNQTHQTSKRPIERPLPRDLPMPEYRFQNDSGGSKIARRESKLSAPSNLLSGCNFGS